MGGGGCERNVSRVEMNPGPQIIGDTDLSTSSRFNNSNNSDRSSAFSPGPGLCIVFTNCVLCARANFTSVASRKSYDQNFPKKNQSDISLSRTMKSYHVSNDFQLHPNPPPIHPFPLLKCPWPSKAIIRGTIDLKKTLNPLCSIQYPPNWLMVDFRESGRVKDNF